MSLLCQSVIQEKNISMLTKLTIIIATYNAEDYLETALESVINQKYHNWECVVVDGGSTDKTLDIIDHYESLDNRFCHISEKDRGIYDAFNKGWKMAKGEWVYYLGSDDRLCAAGLDAQMKVAENVNSNIGVVNGGVIRITQDNCQREMYSHGFIGGHQGMIMRRSAIEELGGFDLNYKVIADYDLFIRMKHSHWGVVNTKNILAYFSAGGYSEKLSATGLVMKEKYLILKANGDCRYPLLRAIKDAAKTILGFVRHNYLHI